MNTTAAARLPDFPVSTYLQEPKNPNRGHKTNRICPICGKAFTVLTSQISTKIPRVCCSNKCRHIKRRVDTVQRHQAFCLQCGQSFIREHGRLKFCGPACRDNYARRFRKARQCEYCGKEFIRKARGGDKGGDKNDALRFCSRKCGSYKRPDRKIGHRKGKPKFCRIAFRECRECSHIFSVHGKSSSRSKHCSKQCAATFNKKGVYARLAEKYAARPIIEKKCVYCCEIFKPRLHQDRIFCSPRCGKAAARDKYKVIRRGYLNAVVNQRISMRKLMERDGYRCQICKKLVIQSAKVPHPKAPTKDHIIPLSKGGTHEYRNVQLAHFSCNSARGNRGAAQTRLF